MGKSTKYQILDEYKKIAFASLTDYLEYSDTDLVVKNSKFIDGAIISEVSQTSGVVKVKLYDKMKALEFLAKYYLLLPLDNNKIDFDQAKMDLINARKLTNEQMIDISVSYEDDGGANEC